MFSEKEQLVREVFATVASKYDLMNDLMSGGLHRWWKHNLIKSITTEYADFSKKNSHSKDSTAPKIEAKQPLQILDLAAGTGDISFGLLKNMDNAHVTLCDPSAEMLKVAKERLINKHFAWHQRCQFELAPAESLPFNDAKFDLCTLSFGLRNFSQIERSLHELARVLKPGGRLYCLEFIRQERGLFNCAYQLYAKQVIPKIGKLVTKSEASYDYLVNSIENFYSFDELTELFEDNGFEIIYKTKMTPGVAASFCLANRLGSKIDE